MKMLPFLVLLAATSAIAKSDFAPAQAVIKTPEQIQKERENLASWRKKKINDILSDCHAYTKAKDVNGRRILPEVMEGMGGQCKPKKPTMGYEKFMNDIDKTLKAGGKVWGSQKIADIDRSLWDETSKIALDKSVRATLSLHHRFFDVKTPMSESRATEIVCKHMKNYCASSYKGPEKKVIQSAVKKFLADNKKQPIKFMDHAEQEKLKKQFNTYIYHANKACQVAKKKTQEIESEYSCQKTEIKLDQECLKTTKLKGQAALSACFKTKTNFSTPAQCDQMIDKKYEKLRELQGLASRSITFSQQMLLSTEIAPLLISKKFREHVGLGKPDFVYESCMKGNGYVFRQVDHDDIHKARGDMYWLAHKELENIEKKRKDGSVPSGMKLEDYLKTHPDTIAELLKKKPDIAYAKALCSHVKEIHWDDKVDHIIDGVIMGVGVVAGLAFTICTAGAGASVVAPAMMTLSAISLGTTALGVAKNYADYRQQLAEDQQSRQAAATQQRSLTGHLAAMEVSDQRKDDLESSMKWGVGGLIVEAAGLGFTKLFSFEKIALLKKSPGMYRMLNVAEGSTDLARMEPIATGSKNFTITVQKLKNPGVLKNLNEWEQTHMAALFSRIDEAKGIQLVKKLAAGKKEDLNKFFLMLDDMGKAEMSANKILGQVDDFLKTGKTPRFASKVKPTTTVAKTTKPATTSASASEVAQVGKTHPESLSALTRSMPKASKATLEKLLADANKLFGGKVADADLALMVEHYVADGMISPELLLQKFNKVNSMKQKYASLFAEEGMLSKFSDEPELMKLAYLEELELNGLPVRAANGEMILDASSKPIRKSMAKMTPAQKMDELKKELAGLSNRNPCSL